MPNNHSLYRIGCSVTGKYNLIYRHYQGIPIGGLPTELAQMFVAGIAKIGRA